MTPPSAGWGSARASRPHRSTRSRRARDTAGKRPAVPRGTGRSRRDRRVLRRGGEGIAAILNRAVGEWEGARVTPMFGRWGYFVGDRLFGCYPLRLKDRDLWVRLSPRDQARALAQAAVRPHRRFAARGWIEYDVVEPSKVPSALAWLRRGYAHARGVPEPG
jgi:Luciferase